MTSTVHITNTMKMQCLTVCTLLSLVSLSVTKKYTPTWESLDSRPLPGWYDDAKIGIFIHWGVFSVPALHGSNFWNVWHDSKPGSDYYEFMKENYRDNWTYADFARDFTAEFFDPVKWVRLFGEAGAKYLVFVTKHHEGFCNWNTNRSFNWNSMQVGPKRDLVAELTAAVRKTDMKLGLYHSMLEWYNPLLLKDQENEFRTSNFPPAKTIPELHELVNTFKPDLIWSDGIWLGDDNYYTSKEFLAWLYNESPIKDTVIVNDRWGNNTRCKHGGYVTCTDKYNPKVLQPRKFETCDSIQKDAWGYRRDTHIGYFLTITEIISRMVTSISCGGNYLLNVGPTHDGRILPIFEERLLQMGEWLRVNGEAIYKSKPWAHQHDNASTNVWYTTKKDNTSYTGYAVYAFVLDWPDDDNWLYLGSVVPSEDTRIHMLGYNTLLFSTFTVEQPGLRIRFPSLAPHQLPSLYAWVLKLINVKPLL